MTTAAPGWRALLGLLRAEASGERALATLTALAQFHRVQASPGYDAAATWLAREIERLGLVPEIETAPGDGVTRRLGMLMPQGWESLGARATLWLDGSERLVCDDAAVPLALVLRSAPARGRFPIVVLDDGSEDAHYTGLDVRGAVVLTRGAAHRVHTLAVVERGAAGLLIDGRRLVPPVRGPFDDPDQVAYTSFWWNGDEPRGWGFVLSPRTGAALREALARGARAELEVAIESRRFATTIPLLSTRILANAAERGNGSGRGSEAGTGGADGEVLVIAHLCHPRPSANDNASGAAASLETARALQALAARGAWRPRRAVRFLWVPELTGSYAWLSNDPARAGRIVAAVNLDMVGQDQERCGSTFLLESPPCFVASFAEHLLAAIRREAPDWVNSYSGPGHYSLTRMAEVPYSGGSDHALFVDPAVGVPCPMLIQWPDRYYHSSHDTPDKSDPRSLALAVRCAGAYAAHLAALDADGARELLGLVARSVRRAALVARDAAEASRALRRAALAGDTALASLARAGADAGEIECEREAFAAFVARETPLPARDAPAVSATDRRVPRRAIGAPLEFLRHLLPGWNEVPRAEREALRGLELGTPGAPTVFEVAWYACDGRRDLAAIAELVALETGHAVGEAIAAFFAWAVRRGLAAWVTGSQDVNRA